MKVGTANRIDEYLLYISALCFLYLVANSFAHERGGDMERQHVLKEELVDVLHGLHLLSLRLETTIQQEVHAATQLVLTEKQICVNKLRCKFICI